MYKNRSLLLYLLISLTFSSISISQDRKYSKWDTKEIIEKAVERKAEVREDLKSYIFKTYTKSVCKNRSKLDRITMILEFHSIFYYNEDNLSKEVCGFRQGGETGLIWNPDLLNVVLYDTLKFDKNMVVTPLGENTFYFYKYKVRGTVSVNEKTVYEVEVKPNKKNIPLIDGTLLISENDYSVCGLEFTFNKATKFPGGIRDIAIKQQYALFYEKYWFPVSQHSVGDFTITRKHQYLRQPVYEYGISENTIIVYDYLLNDEASYNVFINNNEDLEAQVMKRNSQYWEHRIGLLDNREHNAFIRLKPVIHNYYEINSLLNKVK